MKLLLILFLSLTSMFAHDGWIDLQEEGNLKHWKSLSDNNPFKASTENDNSLISTNKKGVLLYKGDIEKGSFKNFELKFDLKLANDSSGGLEFHSSEKDGKTTGGLRFSFDGGLYDMKDPKSRLKNVETIKAESWIECRLLVQNHIIKTNFNGQQQNYEITKHDSLNERGLLAIVAEKGDIQIRNLHIRLLPDVTGFTGYKLKETKPDPKNGSLPENAMKVLLWSKTSWYRHPQIPELSGWLVRYLAQQNIRVDVSESSKDMNAKNLSRYKAVILLSTTDIGKSLDEKQRLAFKSWYQNGGGIVAMHAALVHHKYWDWYSELVGCDFDSDSDHTRTRVLVDPKAEGHPIVAGESKSFWYDAEWLNFDKSVTGLKGVKVLLRADESTYEPVREFFKKKGGKAMGDDHPVAWTREWQGGRFFYTGIGHDERSTNTPFGRKHVLEAIKWAAGEKN